MSIKEIVNLVRVHRITVWHGIHCNDDKRNASYKPELAQKKYSTRMQSRNYNVRFTEDLKI